MSNASDILAALPKWLRLAAAVVVGFIVGSIVNMAVLTLGGQVVPPPPGADVKTMEGLVAAMPRFEPRHFVFPFLAHALGTLAGAFVAALIGRTAGAAWAVGALFLLGGIANVAMLPAPAWFSAVDLLLAYAPAAWLGHRLALRLRPASFATPAAAP